MKKLMRHKLAFIISLLIVLVAIGATGYFIYSIALLNNIEDFLRLVGSIVLGIIILVLILLTIRFLRKFKKVKLTIVLILLLILSAGQIFLGYNVQKVYGALSRVSDNDGYTTYSSSLVTLSTNDASSLSDVGDEVLGILADETSIEGYVIPEEVIEKESLTNETKEYSSYIAMIDDLLAGNINYIFLPTNYSVMFGSMEGYTDIKDKTKIILTEEKELKDEQDNTTQTTNTKAITEPFTILLMGVDSEEEEMKSSAFNGDSLMLITFNPTTLSSTILSIPRDSYVPISCFAGQRKNKITHAAWQGESCMINTIQNFLDVKIDYYVKINFKGVVKLVDALGGVEIDVPYNLCEQDSSRRWGEHTVYIRQGLQTLNGEQALAYARNRHPNPSMCSAEWTNYTSNDFIRGQHQQEVVEALLDKFKSINSLDTVYNLLDTISASMSTNMTTDQILSLYNVLKDIASKSNALTSMADVLGIQRLYLNGYDARIYDYGGTNLELYNYVLYDDSVKAVSDAMKENLGLKEVETVKSFSFNINEPYEEEVIGQDVTGSKSLVQLPNFIGETVSYVNSFCSQYGIRVTVEGSGTTVVSQSVPAKANVEDVSSITITTNTPSNSSSTTTDDEDDPLDDFLPSDPTGGEENGDSDGTGDSGDETGGADNGDGSESNEGGGSTGDGDTNVTG